MTEQAFTLIADKLRRAARNQERLHLDYELVRAILTSPLYPTIAQLESEELARLWQDSSASDSSGSLGETTGASGPSAGMIEALEPGVESQLASAASTMAIRQGKRRRPLPNTSNGTGNRKRSTRAHPPASAES